MTKVLTKIVFLLVMITVFFKNDIYDVQANTITDNSEDIISLIESIASEVEVTSIEELDEDVNKIEVNTEEELFNLIKELSKETNGEQGTLIDQTNTQPMYAPFAYASFTRKSILDSVLTFRHITYDYYYSASNGKINSVKNIKGTYTGAYVFNFKQERASYTLSADKKTINFTIRGYAFAGVSYKGTDFGVKYPQTWNYKHTPR